MPESGHVPVLLEPVLRLLAPQTGEVAVDCTAGRGGHAAALAARLGPTGTLVAVDLDEGNLAYVESRLRDAAVEGGAPRFVALHGSFADAPARLIEAGLTADVVLADLGFSSIHVDDPARGFSFAAEGPLDMRYDRSRGRTAAELLRAFSERELTEMLLHLGEEPLAAKIAGKIAQVRRREPIETTRQLAGLVEEAYGARARYARLHPATRTFMALRIAVNDELNALSTLLRQVGEEAERVAAKGAAAEAAGWLRCGSRVAIIAFHSLEDRLVKHAFASAAGRGLAARLTRRPVVADDAELAANPRARPAKLRAIALGHAEDRVHGEDSGREDDDG
ncbi:MAG TPA: 16S rRNA (cytosine(1402)-N(4))-methyltransferase RsmH [Phycisphaerales bacterium]|nr:16S rRNA (cytosine(1402)-N(4))-methyltransferase RsmH [Phycisphaerales bacterium]HMP36117.1 16S rRNA (cytosine(1402)-N(4))-methyltransferase RsmH [Phycisphaerales bacterium]